MFMDFPERADVGLFLLLLHLRFVDGVVGRGWGEVLLEELFPAHSVLLFVFEHAQY